MNRFDVQVKTTIVRSDGSGMWRDVMEWDRVDQTALDWLAGSCKVALFELIGKPEVVQGESYSLIYETTVRRPNGTIVLDRSPGPVEFPRLSYETVCAFQDWAMSELAEMKQLLMTQHYARRAYPRALTEIPRSRWQAYLSIAGQVIRNRWRRA